MRAPSSTRGAGEAERAVARVGVSRTAHCGRLDEELVARDQGSIVREPTLHSMPGVVGVGSVSRMEILDNEDDGQDSGLVLLSNVVATRAEHARALDGEPAEELQDAPSTLDR